MESNTSSQEAIVQPQELSGKNVRVLVRRKPSCIVEFEVFASPELAKVAHQKAVKEVAKEATFPGFRKGKAPDHLILKNFPAQVNKKWQEVAANLAFVESQEVAKISPLQKDSRVSFDVKSQSLEQGFHLTFSFETEPSVPSVDPSQMQLKAVEHLVVNEEKVEETIRQVQLFFAKWNTITDRPVQEGDFVLLDVDVFEEDGSVSKLFVDTRFEVIPKSMAKWMRELVLGMEIGMSKEGTSFPDDDAKPEEKESFKPKKAKITLKAIEQPIVPDIDDKFAKQLGVSNVKELKENVEKLLREQADAHVREAKREQATEFLLSQYIFDLPRTLIEREAQFRLRQLMSDQQYQNYWERMSEDERRKSIDALLKQSERAVRMFYLCRKIITDAKIAVSPADLPPTPNNFLEALIRPRADMHFQQNSEMHQAEAYSRLILEKAEDYLIDHAKQT
jgi:trigger factor